jgi:hypothetical protein
MRHVWRNALAKFSILHLPSFLAGHGLPAMYASSETSHSSHSPRSWSQNTAASASKVMTGHDFDQVSWYRPCSCPHLPWHLFKFGQNGTTTEYCSCRSFSSVFYAWHPNTTKTGNKIHTILLCCSVFSPLPLVHRKVKHFCQILRIRAGNAHSTWLRLLLYGCECSGFFRWWLTWPNTLRSQDSTPKHAECPSPSLTRNFELHRLW